jgi:hypothetical protein
MSMQILKQPDGLYAIWSTFSDELVVEDATAEEIVVYLRERAARLDEKQTRAELARLESDKPQRRFGITYEEAKHRSAQREKENEG